MVVEESRFTALLKQHLVTYIREFGNRDQPLLMVYLIKFTEAHGFGKLERAYAKITSEL